MAEEKIYTLKELQEKLTEKERILCHEYIIDWNGTRAAKKAGYTEKAPRQAAYDTLTKTYIKQYIAFIKDDIAKEAQISKLSLISELKKIAFSSIAQINEDWITRKDFNQLKQDNPDILDTIQEIDTRVIRKVYSELNDDNEFEKVPYDIEYVKIKLYDKRGAIQDILKAMGWNEAEKSGEEDTTIILEFGDSIDMEDYKDTIDDNKSQE